MDNEFQTKYNDYLTNQATMSELVRKNKRRRITISSASYSKISNNKIMKLIIKKKSAELTEPIMDKAKKGIGSCI